MALTLSTLFYHLDLLRIFIPIKSDNFHHCTYDGPLICKTPLDVNPITVVNLTLVSPRTSHTPGKCRFPTTPHDVQQLDIELANSLKCSLTYHEYFKFVYTSTAKSTLRNELPSYFLDSNTLKWKTNTNVVGHI